jgi:uncharacterized membrane protein
MTSDNPTADRLLNDARKKTAAQEKPLLAQIGVGIGALGVVLGLVSLAILSPVSSPAVAWVTGAVAAILGGISLQRGAAVKLAKIALVLGVVAILVGTFRFTLWYVSGS